MGSSAVTLAVIIICAAVLRFVGLGSGIPFNVGVDEPQIVDRAVGMIKTGDFNPHFFDYPGLYIYIQAAAAALRFIAGANRGEWTSLDHFTSAEFYLWGRAVTALFGTLTVLLVYQIGMRWGTRVAALAAGLMAVMPLHVRESHYVLTDVPVTFFVTLTLLLTLRAHERERALDFAWAGATAGLAAATKYPGGLVLLLPLLAVWMTLGTKPSRLIGSLVVPAAAGLTFLLAAPYTLLDLPAFLNAYGNLASHYSMARGGEAPGITYSKHLSRSLGVVATLLVLTGLGLGAVRATRGPGRVRWTLTILFPIVFFYFLSGQSLVQGRYLLPLLPFVCLLAAAGCVSGVSLLRRFDIPRWVRTTTIAAVTIAAVLPPTLQSIGFVRAISRTGTVEQAYQWIRTNLPKGSKIVIETDILRLDQDEYSASNVPQLVLDFRAPQDYDAYRKGGTQYLIASSQRYGDALDRPHQFPEQFKAYMTLFEQSRELARFTPDANHPGPELRVYKLQ
jgi:4-amino-4-deoxy-L-arabinose transferase-like glycosyltransferase